MITPEGGWNRISRAAFTYFGCTINILDRKDDSQAVEQDFSQSRDQLCGGYQDIHTVWPEEQTEEDGAGMTSSPSTLISENPKIKLIHMTKMSFL